MNFIFHHIPKCGGTSITETFRKSKWFQVVPDYQSDWTPDGVAKFIQNKHDLAEIFTPNHKGDSPGDNRQSILCGHFELEGARVHQRYPETIGNPDYFLFTMVRDPLEVAQSLYFYEKSRTPDYAFSSLQERLAVSSNYLAKVFGCDESNYKKVLGRYSLVGLMEDIQAFLDILATVMTKEKESARHDNQSPRDSFLSERDIADFKSRNQLDFMIYDYCTELYARQKDDYLR